MVQWFCSISESQFDIWTSYLQIMKWYDTMIHLNMNVVSIIYMSWFSDFCLHGPMILSFIKKPIWHMNIISSDYQMLWHSVWPQYECRSLWPIFHGPVILLYSWKTIWHMNFILPDYEMVWPDNTPQYECTSLWPIFHGPVILPYSWKSIWHINIILPCTSLWPIFHGPVILLYIWKSIWHHIARLWNGMTQWFTSI